MDSEPGVGFGAEVQPRHQKHRAALLAGENALAGVLEGVCAEQVIGNLRVSAAQANDRAQRPAHEQIDGVQKT
jgi:hypothetical protein